MDLMKFDTRRRACGKFLGKIDMEIGDPSALNDFETDDSLSMGEYIAEIGGEFGGVVESTNHDSVRIFTGYTWRGLLNKWIIEEHQWFHRPIYSGDLNDITRTVLTSVLGGFFRVPETKCGIEASMYRFPQGATVLAGLMGLYEIYGCKMTIRNVVENKKLQVYVSAEKRLEKRLSESSFDASVTLSKMGINHLICVGKGEDSKGSSDEPEAILVGNRIMHLYLHPDGRVGFAPYYTGFEERQAYYEHNSKDVAELFDVGSERLKKMASYKKMELQTIYAEADIGDYLTAAKDGQIVREPVVRKILTGANGIYETEIKTKGD